MGTKVVVCHNPDGTLHFDGRNHYPPIYFPGQVGWTSLSYQTTDSTGHTASGVISVYISGDSSSDLACRCVSAENADSRPQFHAQYQ